MTDTLYYIQFLPLFTNVIQLIYSINEGLDPALLSLLTTTPKLLTHISLPIEDNWPYLPCLISTLVNH